ncbi:MAG TPA: SIMPL domain-containing protein [Blastocatellia bacterium]|nr:SIMPL domain-containing protein [Blastocatellia bacterium]
MIRILIVMLISGATVGVCFAQASGNVGYSQSGGNARAKQNERNKRLPVQGEMPPNATSMFIDASVLMNVKADEYVAVFGLLQEGTTVAECNQKMDAVVKEFSAELRRLGIGADDFFVDFAAQNKIYGFEVAGGIAKEKLVGFELKKNISVHYRDKLLLDKLVIAASQSKIFDLIRVDYIVKDTSPIEDRLMEEAARIIRQKTARYEKLLGLKLQPPAQVYAEKSNMYFPTEMYDSYVAQESEEMSSDYYRQKYAIQGARKSRTFFFNPLNADGFDHVINPVVIEPVVQFTLYLKVRYEIEQAKGR